MSFLGSVDESLRILCDIAVKATVLLGLSWLVLRCLARSSAAIRHRVGSLTMIGLLLLPVLSWQLPAWQWAVLPAPASSEPASSTTDSGATVGSFGPTVFSDFQPSVMPSLEPPAIHSPFPPDASDTLDPPIPAATSTPVPEVQPAAPVPWLALVILGGWSAGMALCLVGLGVGLWQVRQLTQHSQPVRDNAWLTLITDLRARLRFRRPIELRESSQSIVPLTWGLIRPRVMLPAAARGWAEPMRRVVLLHELAHVQRADVAYQLLARLACAVYWFHPLAWLALKRLRQDREQACDDAVIHTGEQPSTYAEQLLEVARLYYRPSGLTLAVEMARGSSLETRLRSLFDAARSHAPLNWRTGASVTILTASILCAIAVVRPVERTTQIVADEPKKPRTLADQEWGLEQAGLRCRLLPVSPDSFDEQPEAAGEASRFLGADDVAFAVELKNVSDKPIPLLGIRMAEQSNRSEGYLFARYFAPHLFDFVWTDAEGQPISRPERTVLGKSHHPLRSASVHEIAPGKSLTMLLRPSQFGPPHQDRLSPGAYRLKIQYHIPEDTPRAFVGRPLPNGQQQAVWTGKVASNEVSFQVAKSPGDLDRSQLVWGEPKDGLQAAVEFRRSTTSRAANDPPGTFPVNPDVRTIFHVKNVSNRPIQFVSENGRQADHCIVTTEGGETQPLKGLTRLGLRDLYRWNLQPGETAELPWLGAGIQQLDQAGKYTVQYRLDFSSSLWKSPDNKQIAALAEDWQQSLETGATPISLRPRTNEDAASSQTPAAIQEKVAPAVLDVVTVRPGDPFFRSDRRGMGFGLVIDERGYAVTANHVVDGAETIRIAAGEARQHDARVVANDSIGDLAILQYERTLPTAPLGSSAQLNVGDAVYVFGGVRGNRELTRGTITALGRELVVNDKLKYRNLIQFDAGLAPGDSGGPLINANGEIIGINVAIRTAKQRVGFAIPIDDAKKVIAKLMQKVEQKEGDLRSENRRGRETRAEQEPAANPDQASDGGSKLLRELRRKAAPLLKELAEKNGYGLIEGEHVKCLPPPYPPLRGESFRIGNPGVTENFLDQPSVSLLYHWKKGALTIWGMRTGDLQNPGRTVLNLCDEILGVKPQQIEGSPELLRQGIPGDWVVRRDAPEESRLEQLNTILADKAKIPVRLEFRTVEQAVYVAQGKYQLTPLPGYAGEDRTQLEDRLSITDALHVFAEEGGQLRGGGTGNFQAFLDNLGSWINSPIVDETTSGPVRELSWQYFGPPNELPKDSELDDETDRVLSNVAKQTGFTFKRALRKIRILTAEGGDLRSENRRGRETRAEQDAEQPAAKIARLRNGLTVELLGVAKPGATKADECWNPEGGAFDDLKEWPKPDSVRNVEWTHELLLRITGRPPQHPLLIHTPAFRFALTPQRDGDVQRIGIAPKDDSTSLRVGIPETEWGPWQTVNPNGAVTGVEIPQHYRSVYDTIRPVFVKREQGWTFITWSNLAGNHRAVLQLDAQDQQGQQLDDYAVTADTSRNNQIQFVFKHPDRQPGQIQYRLRNVEHWVTFENISLEPGRRTEVTVKTETIPVKKEDQRSENRQGQEKLDNQDPILVHIVIAEHVMLWEGKEIVAWEEIEKRFKAIPDPSRIQPSFQFTNGAIKLGLFDTLQREKIFPLTKQQLKIDKLNLGSLSPRAGVRFDRIKTADDLKPNEADRIEGRVLNSDGVPVADVEVLLITPLPKESPVHDVYLTHGQIRNPLEEVATRTDLEGRFRLYPPAGTQYLLIATHPEAGFALVRKETFVENKDIKLGEWSEFTIVLPEDAEEKYVSLTSYLPEGNSLPQVSLHLNSGVEEDQETPGTFVFSHVPFDLETGVSRAFPDEENQVTHHLQDVRVRLKEGESKNVELGPVSKDQKAKFLFKLRPQAKPKKESSALDPPAENSKTATTLDNQKLPRADVLQFQLAGLDGTKLVTPDSKPVLTLPGRFHLAAEAEQATTTKFQLRDISGQDGVVLNAELICLPKSPEIAKFLAENAVSLELQDADVALASAGGGIKFLFLPHRQPNEQWDGHYGVLTMGGDLSEEELAEVRTNLKDRGVLLVELRLGIPDRTP